MKITQEEKNVLEILRNLSGENIDRITRVLQALMMYALMNYSEEEPIVVPLFGEFTLTYKGDKISFNGREALIDTTYNPSQELKYNIGIMEDLKKQGNTNISEIPIIKEITRNIENQLKCVMNETELNFEENDLLD